MQNKYRNLLIIIFIIAISLYAMKSLFHPGFFTSHDGWHIVARLFYFDQIIKDGQIPVRFSTNLLNGFGYPLFIFSYHLPWILAEPLVLLGFNIFDAIRVIFIITYIISGVIMYFWIKQMFGKKAALISALVFLFTPYRFANIYVRANMGEAVSFMTYPLIFWSIFNLSYKKSIKWVCIGGLGLAGAILSHVMVIFLFFIPIGLYVLSLFFITKKKLRFIFQLLLMIITGFGVSAYYLLPAIYYKPQTIFADIYKQLYANHFTPIAKLIYSPWGYGALGTNGEMSRQVGIVIWMIILISTLIFTIRLLKKNFAIKVIYIPTVCLISFWLAIFLMTKNSLPLWKLWEKLSLIDFPWRFLSVTTFLGSLLAGWLIWTIKQNKFQIYLIIFMTFLLLYSNRNHLKVNQYTDIPLSLYISSELSTNTDDEYLPKWVSRGYAYQQKSMVANNDLPVTNQIKKSNKIEFDVYAQKSTELKINQMWFPGWNLLVNNKYQTFNKTDFGGISVNLSQGNSHVKLEYKSTLVMIIGNLITIFTLLVIIGNFSYNIYIWKKK